MERGALRYMYRAMLGEAEGFVRAMASKLPAELLCCLLSEQRATPLAALLCCQLSEQRATLLAELLCCQLSEQRAPLLAELLCCQLSEQRA